MTLILKAVEFDKLSAKLRKQYADEQALLMAGWWAFPKYDGCYGMVVVSGGEARMLSRTGEDYSASCGHILSEVKEALEGEDGVVIGEVWAQGRTFPEISGAFRRHRQSDWLQFAIHDMLPIGLETTVPFSQRIADAQDCFPDTPGFSTFVIQREHCVHIRSLADQLKGEGGYDGAILRDPKAGYTIGTARAGEIVKVKPTQSLDLQVLRVLPGEGKHAGRAGALVVSYRGVETAVGTGLSDEERHWWWNADESHLHTPKIIEVEFMGFTEDGALREPRYKALRHDKDKPDA